MCCRWSQLWQRESIPISIVEVPLQQSCEMYRITPFNAVTLQSVRENIGLDRTRPSSVYIWLPFVFDDYPTHHSVLFRRSVSLSVEACDVNHVWSEEKDSTGNTSVIARRRSLCHDPTKEQAPRCSRVISDAQRSRSGVEFVQNTSLDLLQFSQRSRTGAEFDLTSGIAFDQFALLSRSRSQCYTRSARSIVNYTSIGLDGDLRAAQLHFAPRTFRDESDGHFETAALDHGDYLCRSLCKLFNSSSGHF